MRIPERTGKWIEIDRSSEKKGEIVIQVPNSIWAAWQVPIFLNEEDLAANLRSLGWQIVLPGSTAGAAPSAVA